MDNNVLYWLWISRLRNVGSRKLLKLLEYYQTPKRIWQLKKEELIQIKGIGHKLAEKITDKMYRINLEEEWKKIEEQEIQILTIKDKEYPLILKKIYDPPLVLYIKGNKKILNEFSIGVIGCRQCSTYGKVVAKRIAYCLAKQHIHIISGLARGIDTYSHIRVFRSGRKNNSSFRKWIRSGLSKRKYEISRGNCENRRSNLIRI